MMSTEMSVSPLPDAALREIVAAGAKAAERPLNLGGIADPLTDHPSTWIYGPTRKGHQSGRPLAYMIPLREAEYIALAANHADALAAALLAAREALRRCKEELGMIHMQTCWRGYPKEECLCSVSGAWKLAAAALEGGR